MTTRHMKRNFILRTCWFAAIVLVLCSQLTYATIDDNSYIRLSMHDIQTSSESYDGLFLGSSVAWYSLDPAIWQYELGLRFFNMGMNSQSLFATNAVLETVLQTQSPKYCVYGMHWFFLTYTKQEMHISEMSAVTNRVYDQMKPSAAKIHMFWNSVASEELVRMVLPFTRDAQSNIAAVLQTKASEGYRTYTSFRTENVNRNGYIGDGFAIRHRGMEQGMVGSACTESLKPRLHSTLSSAAAQELLAMKKLCQRNGVQLVIIVPPVTRAHMAQMGGQSEIEALFDEGGLSSVRMYHSSIFRIVAKTFCALRIVTILTIRISITLARKSLALLRPSFSSALFWKVRMLT